MGQMQQLTRYNENSEDSDRTEMGKDSTQTKNAPDAPGGMPSCKDVDGLLYNADSCKQNEGIFEN